MYNGYNSSIRWLIFFSANYKKQPSKLSKSEQLNYFTMLTLAATQAVLRPPSFQRLEGVHTIEYVDKDKVVGYVKTIYFLNPYRLGYLIICNKIFFTYMKAQGIVFYATRKNDLKFSPPEHPAGFMVVRKTIHNFNI